jgi:DNA-binding NarL/FixJ family response regulator
LIRSATRSLLERRADWLVCGEATDGNDAVQKACELKPDVVLVDISMPYFYGLDVARIIRERLPRSEILIVTEHDSRFFVPMEPQPAVRGYILKSRLSFDLEPAVDAASKHQALSKVAVNGSL